MPKVLTTGSTLKCANQGKVTAGSAAKLLVAGKPVLLADSVTAWGIVGCMQTNANAGQVPCVSGAAVSGGAANKLTVGGVAVLLDTLAATSKEGVPLKTITASTAGHDKLSAT